VKRAVDKEIVRKEFYSGYPADGDPETQLAARKKAFNRAVHDTQDEKLTGVLVDDGAQYLWLEGPEVMEEAENAEF
jgi:hypothetical protein